MIAPPVFDDVCGILSDMGDDPGVMDFVKLLIPDDMYGIMAVESNRYAQEYLNSHATLAPRSRFRRWTPVSEEEIKGFMAMTIAMGLVKQHSIADYWAKDEVVATPFFGSIMSRDRFMNITSFLHLSHDYQKRGEPGNNPIKTVVGSISHIYIY